MKTFVSTLSFVILFSFFLTAQDATHWRGSSLDGKYTVDNLIQEWSSDGPQIEWTSENLGQGYTSPVFANNKIYVNGMINDSIGVLFELDMKGNELNRYSYGVEFTNSYEGTRSTPTIVDNMAYLYSGLGAITCLDLNTFETIWTKNVIEDFSAQNIMFGYTESLLVDGDKIFVTPGGQKDNVVALNRMTGDLIWSCSGLGEASSYNTPLLIELPERKMLVVHTSKHVMGIDADSGEMLWSWEHAHRFGVHPNTAIYADGGLLVFCSYDTGAIKLNLSDDGSSVSLAWTSEDFDGHMGGAIVMDGYLYGSGYENDLYWKCLDWETGEIKYKEKAYRRVVCIAANDKLIGYTQQGQLFMADSNPDSFSLLGETMVELGDGEHYSHPVIFDNTLYVRHGSTLIAYKISA